MGRLKPRWARRKRYANLRWANGWRAISIGRIVASGMILYTLIPAYKWNKEGSDGQRAGTKDFNQSDSLAFVIFKMRDL